MSENVKKEPSEKTDNPGDIVTGSGGRRLFLSRKTAYKIGSVAAILILVLAGFAVYKKYGTTKPVCTDATIGQINNLYKGGQVQTVAQKLNTLKQSKGFQGDPNCLYLMADYNIRLSKLDTAQSYINQLKTKFGDNPHFSKKLASGEVSLSSLQKELDETKQAEQNIKGTILPVDE
jgi:hypothetical protein